MSAPTFLWHCSFSYLNSLLYCRPDEQIHFWWLLISDTFVGILFQILMFPQHLTFEISPNYILPIFLKEQKVMTICDIYCFAILSTIITVLVHLFSNWILNLKMHLQLIISGFVWAISVLFSQLESASSPLSNRQIKLKTNFWHRLAILNKMPTEYFLSVAIKHLIGTLKAPWLIDKWLHERLFQYLHNQKIIRHKLAISFHRSRPSSSLCRVLGSCYFKRQASRSSGRPGGHLERAM